MSSSTKWGEQGPSWNTKSLAHITVITAEVWTQWAEVRGETGYLYRLRVSPPRDVPIMKRKGVTWLWRNLADTTLIEWSRLIWQIYNSWTNLHHVLSGLMHQGRHIAFVVFLPKVHNLILIMKKEYQTNLDWETFSKITNQHYQKNQSLEKQDFALPIPHCRTD